MHSMGDAQKKQGSELLGVEMLLYRSSDGDVRVECLFQDETVWLTQKAVAALFGVQRPAIIKHIGNIFESGELQEKVVVSILETTTSHGAIAGKTQTGPVKYYNLDAIIAVGYRVNSYQARSSVFGPPKP